MATSSPQGKNCLDDTVLLAIAQGRMVEPALSHFLSHLENCTYCCERSEHLGHLHPAGITTLLNKFALVEKTKTRNPLPPETKEYPWQKKLQNLGPKLLAPHLSEPTPEGTVWFGPWEILGVLGEGRAAVVYKARDNRLGREVALKVLRPDVATIPGMAESFLGEAKAMAQVRDPHLVVLYSHGSQPQPFLEMELLEGETLAQALEKGPMEPSRALKITRDVALGIAQLHARGLVHRDLKPANIWLLNRDGQEQAVLMDLGLVAFGSTKSGTPGYMAPELLGNEGQRAQSTSDIFSLGALLRAMALGGDSVTKSTGQPSSILFPLIQALMADTPEKRPSAKMTVALIDDLLLLPQKKARRIFLGSVAGGLALGGLGIWAFNRRDAASTQTPQAQAPQEADDTRGARPFKIIEKAFTEWDAKVMMGFHIHQRQAFLQNPLAFYRFDLDRGVKDSFPTPFRVEQFSFAGTLVAIANSQGVAEVWNLASKAPQMIQRYHLPQGTGGYQLISISLAPNLSGKLLVAMRDMVFTATPTEGVYPETLTSHSEAKLFANNLQPAAMVLDSTGNRVISLHGRGGITLHDLDEKHQIIWAFRPFVQGPPIFSPRPSHPGQLGLASPNGDVSIYGPEIIRKPKGTPFLHEVWFYKISGRLLELEFVNENLLVAQTSMAPCPLKYTLAHLGGQIWKDLACESPVSIAADQETATLYCLDTQGRIHVWNASDLTPDETE